MLVRSACSLSSSVFSSLHSGSSSLSEAMNQTNNMRFVAHRYYNEAIRQCPTDKPCAVFINLNLPPQVDPGGHFIPWWPEIQKLIGALPQCSATEPTAETCLVLTNFAGHFAGSDEAPSNRYIFTFPDYVRHPLKHPDTLAQLLQAMEAYAQIPMFE